MSQSMEIDLGEILQCHSQWIQLQERYHWVTGDRDSIWGDISVS